MLCETEITYFIEFYDFNECEFIEFNFTRKVKSEFDAVAYAVDWVESKRKVFPMYKLETVKVYDAAKPFDKYSILMWIDEV